MLRIGLVHSKSDVIRTAGETAPIRILADECSRTGTIEILAAVVPNGRTGQALMIDRRGRGRRRRSIGSVSFSQSLNLAEPIAP